VVLGTVADLTQGRSELVLENAFLRQQVIALSRPRADREVERLVVRLARENDWDIERMEGELKKLGYTISHETCAGYLRHPGENNLSSGVEVKDSFSLNFAEA
jgi:hypothetical protein